MIKKIGCMFLSLSLAVSMFTISSLAQENTDNGLLKEMSSGQIEAELISAIDGSHFISSFDPATGTVSSYTMDRELKGQRYGYSEEEFEELVELNHNLPTQINESHLNAANPLIETPSVPERAPRYVIDTGLIYLNVPQKSTPQIGVSIGGVGSQFKPDMKNREILVRTYEFNSNWRSIDVFFTNDYGDDYSTVLGLEAMESAVHRINFPGEWYSAQVSSRYGNYTNVPLRMVTR